MNALTLIQATVEPTINDKTGVTTREPVDLKEALHSHLQTNQFGAMEHVGTIHRQPVTGRLTSSQSAGWEFKYDGKSYALYPRTDGQFLFYEAHPDWAGFAKPVNKEKVRVFRYTERSRYPVKMVLRVLAECLAWNQQQAVATVEPGDTRLPAHIVDEIVTGYIDGLLQVVHDDTDGNEDGDSFWDAGFRAHDVHSGRDKVTQGVKRWLGLPGVSAAVKSILGKSRSSHSPRFNKWSPGSIGADLFVSISGAARGFTESETRESAQYCRMLEDSTTDYGVRHALPEYVSRNDHGGLEIL